MSERGARVRKAADLLIELLAGTEMPSLEVYRKAKEEGITNRTLERAKKLVGAKSGFRHDDTGAAWYMSVPKEMLGRKFSHPENELREQKPFHSKIISSDWVSVSVKGSDEKIDIPERKPVFGMEESNPEGQKSSSRIQINAGGYKFEVDEDFPADKLVQILKELDVCAV